MVSLPQPMVSLDPLTCLLFVDDVPLRLSMFQTTEQASGVAPTRSQTSAHSPTLTNETQLLLCACSNIVKVSVIVGTNSVFPGRRTHIDSAHKRAPGDDCTVRSYQVGSVHYTLHQLPP